MLSVGDLLNVGSGACDINIGCVSDGRQKILTFLFSISHNEDKLLFLEFIVA